ncbi:glycosyltransferase involved in cell wall biosynthesis [Halorubrum trapanicum]|uniref:Glycosyltransferase involved in cell wall biosynthesis n=1 Tax=Halorubrum trapanicum TaxID=29284 RepID=A0A8J7R6I8_9EURY|nr:glycosyltransferase [Halorubrum trapanicum]MBP1900767.1 glycosyltransferase involved in cell wall biosynthesis [Halorubrum trapanicum]
MKEAGDDDDVDETADTDLKSVDAETFGSVAVAHGNYLERGGAERVSDELARLFDAPLYYGFGDPDYLPTDVETTSLFNDSPVSFLKRNILTRDLYYAWAAQRLPELTEYDTLVLSKNELSWYVPEDEQTLVHYIHSTPRTPYDLFQQRAGSPITRLYAFLARTLFLPNTNYPDRFVANSELVARRVQRYWGVPSEKVSVVYPPVPVGEYEPRERADYYLTYSRLIPEKRIGAIVDAFDELDTELVVGGAGRERGALESRAPENVTFVGYMDETEKKRRLGEAKALLFNAMNEDFGMIPVEAFASGTPVLGVAEGYTKYQVRDGENGYTHGPNPASIRESIARFEQEGVAWSSAQIQTFAERYSTAAFREGMREAVARAQSESCVTVLETDVSGESDSGSGDTRGGETQPPDPFEGGDAE